MTQTKPAKHTDGPALYRIMIRGHFDSSWSDWFDNMTLCMIQDRGDSVTTLSGFVSDQAALHGLLARIRDLGLILLLVERLDKPAWPIL